MSDTNKITFIHPTTGKEITVELSTSMTPARALSKLVGAQFVKQGDYTLSHDGTMLNSDLSLADQNVTDGARLRLLPATDAGCLGEILTTFLP